MARFIRLAMDESHIIYDKFSDMATTEDLFAALEIITNTTQSFQPMPTPASLDELHRRNLAAIERRSRKCS